MQIDEIGEDELARLVAVRNAVWPHDPETVEGYVDWRSQADGMVWLLAVEAGTDVAAGVGIHGWHSPAGVGRLSVHVLPGQRGRGTGSALLALLEAWLGACGCVEATAGVAEQDDASLAWAARHGYREVGRNSILALDLADVDAPDVAPPSGVEIVRWADRPELTQSLYDVYVEVAPDVPGEADSGITPFEAWLANDMRGASDRPEATFVALQDSEVVGYAKLSLLAGESEVAWHDLTAVRRSSRGMGIAGALKRAEIAWAKQQHYRFLKTFNEERNEPIRRLNERHGYRVEPGFVTVRGRLDADRIRTKRRGI